MIKPLFAGLLLACCLPCLFCGEAPDKTVPETLFGIWTTSNPRYVDRFFELTPDSIMRVGTGGDNVDAYAIRNVEAVPQDALTLYTITYLNDAGHTYEFKFSYDPFDGGIIVFVNQDGMRWTREEP